MSNKYVRYTLFVIVLFILSEINFEATVLASLAYLLACE